jgi:hypothetical protein
MAYAGALTLRMAGYQGNVSIGQYGINHQFLFVDNLIVDPWANTYCSKSAWQGKITAYGGSIKDGIMHGRLIPSDHFELEDEKPEVVEEIPASYLNNLPVPKSYLENNLFKQNQDQETNLTDHDDFKHGRKY